MKYFFVLYYQLFKTSDESNIIAIQKYIHKHREFLAPPKIIIEQGKEFFNGASSWKDLDAAETCFELIPKIKRNNRDGQGNERFRK
eukprot:UN13055